MPLTILDTVFEVVFKFPTCMKCFAKLPLNMTFNAALRNLTFQAAPGGGPFNFIKANLSTVPVSDVKSCPPVTSIV